LRVRDAFVIAEESNAFLPEVDRQKVNKSCHTPDEFTTVFKQKELPLTMLEQGIVFRIELAALLSLQWRNPDRVVLIEMVGELKEGGEVCIS